MAKDKLKCPVMTTVAGVPVADNQNSLTAGARGPDSVADNQPARLAPTAYRPLRSR